MPTTFLLEELNTKNCETMISITFCKDKKNNNASKALISFENLKL